MCNFLQSLVITEVGSVVTHLSMADRPVTRGQQRSAVLPAETFEMRERLFFVSRSLAKPR